jgi:hypothetical protein
MSTLPDPSNVPQMSSAASTSGQGPGGGEGAAALERSCIRCGYSLTGLPDSGKCPECATPVADSRRGFLLRFAAQEWLAKVDSGLGLVLNGILLSIVVALLNIAASFAFSGSLAVTVVMAVMGLATQAMIAYGYFKFSEPDPGYTGIERPDSARQWLRIAVIAGAAIAVVQLLLTITMLLGGGITPGAAGGMMIVLGILGLVGIAAMIAWAVQFFAAILYVRWLAKRVPDEAMVKKTRLYIWLLPVLATVGALIVIGPLIALVLYWNMLNALRKHVKASRAA